jgi:OmpA-OmpF porin, OOP family
LQEFWGVNPKEDFAMRQPSLLIGITLGLFTAGLLPAGPANAQSASRPLSSATARLAEEHAEAAREQADLARENAQRAAEEAAVAEEHAAQVSHQSTSARRAQLERELAELKAQDSDRGLVLTLGDVQFSPNQAELTVGATRRLDPLVLLLKDQPRRTIYIEGHTDSSGTGSYNLELSQRRADAVRDFLVDNGISPNRIVARGYGEADPVASNDTTSGRRENRRVEVIVPREGNRVARETR